MTTPLAKDAQSRRTVGDIMLKLGFVNEQELADAVEVQERTGQPLGQILVEAGAITRLELASALAEQWSEPGSPIAPSPLPAIPQSNGVLIPQSHDSPAVDPAYLAQLHDAVTELARRVGETEPLLYELREHAAESVHLQALEALDSRVSALAERLEATLGRMTELDGTLAATDEQLERLTEGVEQAFSALQAGTGELVERVDALGQSAAAAPTDADLAEVHAALEQLAARPQADPGVAGRVDELAEHVAALGDTAAIDELRSAVGALQSQPAVGRELGERLGAIEARLDAPPDTAPLEELRARVDELAARPQADPDLPARLDALLVHLEQQERSYAEVVSELRAGIAELASRTEPDPLIGSRVDALTGRLDDLSGEVESLAAVAASGEDGVAIAELRAALEELGRRRAGDDDLASRLVALDAAVAALPGNAALDSVRDQVAELAARPLADPGLLSHVDELAANVRELAQRPAVDPSLSGRIDDLEARLGADGGALAELRAAAEELATRPAGDPELAARLTALGGRIDEVAAAHAVLANRFETLEPLESAAVETVPDVAEIRREVDARLADMAARFETRLAAGDRDASASVDPSAPPAAPVPESIGEDIERIRMAIERLGLHIGEHDRALAELMRSRGVTQRLDELSGRLDELAAHGVSSNGAGATYAESDPASGGDTPEEKAEVRDLVRRVHEAESALEADREKLLARIERMASAIDWRLQRLEAGGTSALDN